MRAKRVMKDSLRDLRESAFSTSRMIFETVLSPKVFVVLMRRTPERLMQPEATSSPFSTSRGRLSPVRATVLREEVPSMTVPSRGIFPPGRTTMTSPMLTSSGVTVRVCPPRSTSAVSGRISIRCEMLSRLRPSA